MADIDVRRVHNLGLAAARKAADKLAADLGKKFGLSGDWEGNVLHFERPGVTGSLAINARDLRLAVTLGFLLKAMKGSIEQAVMAELDRLFPAKASAPAKKTAPKPKKAAARPKKAG